VSGAQTDPRAFCEQVLARDFNRLLDEQADLGEAGRGLFESMRAVNGSICVEITGDDATRFALDIENGRMTTADAPRHPPFLTLIQDRTAFEKLAGGAGGSISAMLGGLAGLSGDMRLTRRRMIEFEAVDGSIRIEIIGDGGFTLLTHFGTGARPAEPQASIRLDATAYADLRGGALDLQSAFLAGRVDVTGDMERVMQLAFSAVAPD
jgi:putative sterol carrier protein